MYTLQARHPEHPTAVYIGRRGNTAYWEFSTTTQGFQFSEPDYDYLNELLGLYLEKGIDLSKYTFHWVKLEE